jgi:hypothetical protein
MEHDLPMILVSVGCSLVVGVLSSYLTFRLQLEAFMAMDKEREKHWVQWREGITKDVANLKSSASLISLALLSQRMEQVENRLESIETKLFGGTT